MDIQASQPIPSLLKGALDQQFVGANLITSTVDRLNSGRVGMTPVIDDTYLTQKTVLNAAYGDPNLGQNVDIEV